MENAPSSDFGKEGAFDRLTAHVQGEREAQKAILDAEAELKKLAEQNKVLAEETPAGVWEEQTAQLRKTHMKETPPEAWEAFGKEALEAKKNAEVHGWTVSGTNAPKKESEPKQEETAAPAAAPTGAAEKTTDVEKAPEPAHPADDAHDSIAKEDINKWTGEKPVEAEKQTQTVAGEKPAEVKKTAGEEWSAEVKKFDKIKQERTISPEYYLKAAGARSIEIGKKIPANLREWIDGRAQAYKALPTWKKVAIGAGLSATVAGAAFVTGPTSLLTWGLWMGARIPGFLSGYALTDALQKRSGVIEGDRRKTKSLIGGAAWALAMGAVGQYLVGPYIHEWFSGSTGVSAPTPKDYSIFTGPHATGAGIDPRTEGVVGGAGVLHSQDFPAAQGFGDEPRLPNADQILHPNGVSHIPGAPGHAGIFGESITVTDADSKKGLWGILERKLTESGTLNRNTPALQRNILLDSLEKKLRILSPDKLQELGFRPDKHGRVFIDVIRPGEKLNLSILNGDISATPAHTGIPLPPVRPAIPSIPVTPDVAPDVSPGVVPGAPLDITPPLAPQGRVIEAIAPTAPRPSLADATPSPGVETHNVATRVIEMAYHPLKPEDIKGAMPLLAKGILSPESSDYSNWRQVFQSVVPKFEDYRWLNQQLIQARDVYHVNLEGKTVQAVLDEVKKAAPVS